MTNVCVRAGVCVLASVSRLRVYVCVCKSCKNCHLYWDRTEVQGHKGGKGEERAKRQQPQLVMCSWKREVGVQSR
jgi:hypothetical protein